MVAVSMPSRNSVAATLNYYLDPGKDGDNSFFDGTVIETRRTHAEVPVQVTDLRGQESEFLLDKQGFQLLVHPSIEKEFTVPERIRDGYYSECAELLQNMSVPRARRVPDVLNGSS